jgi:hypothetical protein
MHVHSAAASVARIRAIKGAFLTAAVVAVLLAVPATTFAAKGGGGNTAASISLAATSGQAGTQPALGSTIWFNVSAPSNVNNPRVQVMCYQNGAVVYGETGSTGQATGDGTDSLGYSGFLLGGGWSQWKATGGAADCTASLFYFAQKAGTQTFNVIASTSFAAAG